jgi:hypothetical protein
MKKTHPGSCHCGATRFEVDLDATRGTRCNCSICQKLGLTTAIGKPADLRVLTDESALAMYEWGGKVGQRYFCKTCGVMVFSRGHLPQLGGDYISIPLNALDDVDLRDVTVTHFDGRHNNWMAGARSEPWPVFS